MSDVGLILGLSLSSVGLLVIGLSVPLILRRVSMNPLYGVRIPKAFESEANWYAINAYGGRVLAVAGAALVVFGLCVVAFPPASVTAISVVSLAPVPIVLLTLIPIFRYARRLE
jgi:uncharacterized membrane protein